MLSRNPLAWFVVYLLVIVVFAFTFWLLPAGSLNSEVNALDACYFSIVTITTLGYGEINPVSDMAKIAASAEAIAGIVVIGLFLNSLWQRFTATVEAAQEEKVRKELRENSLKSLKSMWRYMRTVLDEYKIMIYELTTPMADRDDARAIRIGFSFSDLRDLYRPSLITKRGFDKSTIQCFYVVENELANELRFLLSNQAIDGFEKLRTIVVEFLSSIRGTDVSDALLANPKMQLADNLTEMIAGMDERPDIEKYRSNILTPVIILDRGIREKLDWVVALEKEMNELTE